VVEGVFGPGDIIGERAFLHAEPHTYTAIVATDCVLVKISADELDELFAKDRRLAARFSQVLTKRWNVLHRWASDSGSKVRRVVSVVALNSKMPMADVLGERLAQSVATITGSRVLLVRLNFDRNGGKVHAWARTEPCLEAEFRYTREVNRGSSHFDELSLPVGLEPEYATAVAPLISHCARHYDYVLLDAASAVPVRTLCEVVRQTDLAYLAIQPTASQLYELEMLIGQLTAEKPESNEHIRPVVIGSDEAGLVACANVFQRDKRPAHFFVTRIPSSESGGGADPRMARCVNRLAREVARCRIGVALSSGGAKGLAHVGVIQVLEENGIEVDAIAGASMGAYVGALWALGLNGSELEQIAREHEGRWGLRPLLDPVFPPRLGFIRTRRIGERLRRKLGRTKFAELAIPLRILATKLNTLERHIFESGEVADAVEASIAIPGICVPVEIGGQVYVDGGVTDPLPVDVLEEMGIERIIAVNAIPTAEQLGAWQANPQNAAKAGRWSIGRILNTHLNYFAPGNVFDTMIQAFVGAQMHVAENASRRADVVLRPVECDSWWHDFTHPGRYIALGRRVAEEAIDEIRALSRPTPAANETPQLPQRPVAVPPALRAA
jgi:NTE family protein